MDELINQQRQSSTAMIEAILTGSTAKLSHARSLMVILLVAVAERHEELRRG
jgi:hypothetical protein